jgi:hypothetical protein
LIYTLTESLLCIGSQLEILGFKVYPSIFTMFDSHHHTVMLCLGCWMHNTGKTTVANIYGEILRDLGLLSKGEVIVKNPSDFVGSVLGESEKLTNAILDAALGCVLVIDEAYGLHAGGRSRDPYKVSSVLSRASLSLAQGQNG